VEDEAGRVSTYRLVGPDEADASSGQISIDAPLGRALLGKAEGESARVERPAGVLSLTVVEVRWVADES